jgi:bacterioferritin-associated ferredoxin
MYTCVCHALRERDVRRIIREESACTPAEIFKAVDAEPCCGLCVPDMKVLLNEAGVGPTCTACPNVWVLTQKAG